MSAPIPNIKADTLRVHFPIIKIRNEYLKRVGLTDAEIVLFNEADLERISLIIRDNFVDIFWDDLEYVVRTTLEEKIILTL